VQLDRFERRLKIYRAIKISVVVIEREYRNACLVAVVILLEVDLKPAFVVDASGSRGGSQSRVGGGRMCGLGFGGSRGGPSDGWRPGGP